MYNYDAASSATRAGAIGLLAILAAIGWGVHTSHQEQAAQTRCLTTNVCPAAVQGGSGGWNPFAKLGDRMVGELGGVLDDPDSWAATHP